MRLLLSFLGFSFPRYYFPLLFAESLYENGKSEFYFDNIFGKSSFFYKYVLLYNLLNIRCHSLKFKLLF